jgi:hypothetical protein
LGTTALILNIGSSLNYGGGLYLARSRPREYGLGHRQPRDRDISCHGDRNPRREAPTAGVNAPLQLQHGLHFNRRAKSILKPEALVQRSHGRSADSEAEDKRSASSFVMGLPSGAKY